MSFGWYYGLRTLAPLGPLTVVQIEVTFRSPQFAPRLPHNSARWRMPPSHLIILQIYGSFLGRDRVLSMHETSDSEPTVPAFSFFHSPHQTPHLSGARSTTSTVQASIAANNVSSNDPSHRRPYILELYATVATCRWISSIAPPYPLRTADTSAPMTFLEARPAVDAPI